MILLLGHIPPPTLSNEIIFILPRHCWIYKAKEGEKMFCKNCGYKLSDGSRFCSQCGTKTTEDIPVKATPIQIILPEQPKSSRPCPRCKSTNIQFQTITESRKTGCFKVFLYIFLAVSVIGWLVLIPLMLRKKTKTVTYGVCQSCGHRWDV